MQPREGLFFQCYSGTEQCPSPFGQSPTTTARLLGNQAINVKAFQQPGYFGRLPDHTTPAVPQQGTAGQSCANILVAKAVDGVGTRQQGFEDALIVSAQWVECLDGLTGTGSLAPGDSVQLRKDLDAGDHFDGVTCERCRSGTVSSTGRGLSYDLLPANP